MAKTQPRIAVIGCGAATERLHLPALATLHHTPTLLIDPNVDRARQLAAEFGIPRVAADCESAVSECDAAIVAVPHALHAPISTALLRQGIHLLVEKPLAPTPAECGQIIQAAADGRAVLAVGLIRRHLTRIQWTKRALDAGILGPVRSFEIREGSVYWWPVTSPSLFRKDLAGGGVLADTGAHTLDLVCWWFGKPSQITYRDDSYGGVEADCTLELAFPNGVRGVVELSRTRDLPNTAVLRGDSGVIAVRLDDARYRPLTADPPRLLHTSIGGVRGDALPLQRYRELFPLQISDWLRAVATRSRPTVTGEDAMVSVALIDECYRLRQPLEFPWSVPAALQAVHVGDRGVR